jgi:hypothetical protein
VVDVVDVVWVQCADLPWVYPARRTVGSRPWLVGRGRWVVIVALCQTGKWGCVLDDEKGV